MAAKLYSSPLTQKTKIRRPLSQATAPNHSNVFTFVMLLSEGQAGKAWDLSKNVAHLSSQ
jgi:hypothetical protein